VPQDEGFGPNFIVDMEGLPADELLAVAEVDPLVEFASVEQRTVIRDLDPSTADLDEALGPVGRGQVGGSRSGAGCGGEQE
jgi:hypothetical protein